MEMIKSRLGPLTSRRERIGEGVSPSRRQQWWGQGPGRGTVGGCRAPDGPVGLGVRRGPAGFCPLCGMSQGQPKGWGSGEGPGGEELGRSRKGECVSQMQLGMRSSLPCHQTPGEAVTLHRLTQPFANSKVHAAGTLAEARGQALSEDRTWAVFILGNHGPQLGAWPREAQVRTDP